MKIFNEFFEKLDDLKCLNAGTAFIVKFHDSQILDAEGCAIADAYTAIPDAGVKAIAAAKKHMNQRIQNLMEMVNYRCISAEDVLRALDSIMGELKGKSVDGVTNASGTPLPSIGSIWESLFYYVGACDTKYYELLKKSEITEGAGEFRAEFWNEVPLPAYAEELFDAYMKAFGGNIPGIILGDAKPGNVMVMLYDLSDIGIAFTDLASAKKFAEENAEEPYDFLTFDGKGWD